MLQLEHPLDILRIQLERVALNEFQAQNASSHGGKLKSLEMALELIRQCQPILKLMLERERVIRVCPSLRKFEQAQDERVQSNTESQAEGEHILYKTPLSNVTEVNTCAEGLADQTVTAMKCGVSDAVAEKDVVHNFNSDMMNPPETDVTLKERIVNSGCDVREARLSSGSDVLKGRNESEEELAEQEEANSLVQLLEQRLQFVLRSLTKLCLSKSGSSKKEKESSNRAQVYKDLYSMTLRQTDEDTPLAVVSHLRDVLSNIKSVLSQHQETSR